MQSSLGKTLLRGIVLQRRSWCSTRQHLRTQVLWQNGHYSRHSQSLICFVSGSNSQAQGAPRPAELVDQQSRESGSIRVIVGPMFAGKTKELLRSIDDYKERGIQTMVVKSDKDDRYDKLRLSTHDGQTRDCFAVAQLSKLRHKFCAAYQASQVIIIDEAQFFPDLHEFCCRAADDDNKTVIVAGLNGDFRRQKFGQIMDLIPHADDVMHIPADCSYCRAAGQPQAAHFTVRIAADDRQEVVGGADKYAPVCRKHYNVFSRLRHVQSQGQSESANGTD